MSERWVVRIGDAYGTYWFGGQELWLYIYRVEKVYHIDALCWALLPTLLRGRVCRGVTDQPTPRVEGDTGGVCQCGHMHVQNKCAHMLTHAHTHTHTRTHARTHTHTYIHTYTHTDGHNLTHTLAHTHTHMNMHTHTN